MSAFEMGIESEPELVARIALQPQYQPIQTGFSIPQKSTSTLPCANAKPPTLKIAPHLALSSQTSAFAPWPENY